MNKDDFAESQIEPGRWAELDRMFAPESIAIVGVASEGFGFGRGILLSLRAIGFEGKVVISGQAVIELYNMIGGIVPNSEAPIEKSNEPLSQEEP